jgi:hypothetical protein
MHSLVLFSSLLLYCEIFLRCSFHLFHLTLREKGHLAGVDGELTNMIERTLWFMAKACYFEDELKQVREPG